MNNSYFKIAIYLQLCMTIIVMIAVFSLLSNNPNYKLIYSNVNANSLDLYGEYTWPAKGFTRISSYFGPRKSPTAGASTYHNGVDILANQGSNVCAMQEGIVIFAGFNNSGGNMVKIQHENNVVSSYCHLSEKILVKKGDKVLNGEVIGTVGPKYLSNGKLNGATTGVHLHFAVTYNGKYVDPLSLF